MRNFQLLVVVQVAVVVLLVSTQQDGVEAANLGRYAANVKDYLVNMVKEKVINKSKVMVEFRDTMDKIKERFEKEKEETSVSGDEADSLYYKIVVDEVRLLRERIEQSNKIETVSDHDAAELTKKFNENKDKLKSDPKEIIDEDEDLAEESELMNELEKAAQDEAEMGYSMTPESREKLKKRTKSLLGDLMQNELRQLALAMLTGYMSGTGLAPVVVTLASSIRFKLVEFLVNAVMDVLTTIMGRPIEVHPMNEGQVTPQAVPVAA